MTQAERQKRRRERQRGGKVVLHVVVDEVDTTEDMIALRFLHPADQDDRKALEQAVSRFIAARRRDQN